MSGEPEEFGFTPDWRAQIPFWLILPKTLIFVGIPVWLIVLAVSSGFFDLDIIFILGALALVAGRWVVVGADRAVKYRRRLGSERIVADARGLRILPPYGEWRTFPWAEITELSVTTVGGLLGDGFISVEAGRVPCSIPPYVNSRGELLRLIRFRAGLTRESRSWWGTKWTRG